MTDSWGTPALVEKGVYDIPLYPLLTIGSVRDCSATLMHELKL